MHALSAVDQFNSHLHNPFFSLIVSLRCFGLYIEYSGHPSSVPHSLDGHIGGQGMRNCLGKAVRYLLTGFMLIYLHYYAILGSISIGTGGTWTNIKVLIMAWVALFTAELVLLRQHQIGEWKKWEYAKVTLCFFLGELMMHLQTLSSLVMADHQESLKKRVKLFTAIAWVYLAVFAITFFIDYGDKNVKNTIFMR